MEKKNGSVKANKNDNGKQTKTIWQHQTQFTAYCGDFETKDKLSIFQGFESGAFAGYCPNYGRFERLNEIITHHQVKKNVCHECLKQYSLRETEIIRPKWTGAFL